MTATQQRDKRQRFLSLANKRVNRAIKELALVGNLSNRRNYDYTDEEAKKIIRSLQVELERVRNCFKVETELSKRKFEI